MTNSLLVNVDIPIDTKKTKGLVSTHPVDGPSTHTQA